MSASAHDPIRVRSGRPFDRLVNFTDAIVAVAITVLVLPIVELRPKAGETTVWQVIGDNTGQLVTFAFTFVVVAFMWRVHNRIFSRLAGYDDVIFWLNLMWLMLIALLPWSSSMYGTGMDGFRVAADASNWFSGGEGLGGTGLLYWFNLGLISLIGGLIVVHARRYPQLIDSDAPRIFKNSPLVNTRGFIFAVYMFAIGVTTVVAPIIAVWMPFGFFVIGYLLRKREA